MRKFSLALVFSCLLYLPAIAETGRNPFPLLYTDYGTASSALGGTTIALSSGSSSMWRNPSCLEVAHHGEVMLGYRSWLAGIHDEFLVATWPLTKNTLGVGLLYSLTAVEAWDINNQPSGRIYPQSMVFDLALARSFNHRLSIGFGTKILYDNLIEFSGTGIVFDAGFLWRPGNRISIGGCLNNLGPEMKYGGVYVNPPSYSLNLGAAYKILSTVTWGTDISYIRDSGLETRTGIEVKPHPIIALRAGARLNSSVLEWGFWSMPSAGLAIFWKGFKVEYAIAPYGPLGLTHSFSIARELIERPPSSGISIRIIDNRNNAPVNSKLTMVGSVNDTVQTSGFFQRNWVDPGNILFIAEASEYLPETLNVAIEPYQNNDFVMILNHYPHGIVKGVVREPNTHSPVDATIYFKGCISDSVRTEPGWGSYTSNPMPAGDYLVKILPDRPGITTALEEVSVIPGDTVDGDFYVSYKSRTDVLMTLFLNFETGKADILPAHLPILDSIAPVLQNNVDLGLNIEIAGHTDSIPVVHSSYGNNQRLSQARAETIRNYLVQKHQLSENMFQCTGYGDSEPMASNKTTEGRAMNRRIEFRLISSKD